MFAVPGWSLPSTGPAAQTDTSSGSKRSKKKAKTHATGPNAEARSKEPEREAAQQSVMEARAAKKAAAEQAAEKKKADTTTAVTADNVEKLWRTVIAGQVEGGKKRKRGSSGGKKARGEKGEKEEKGEEEGPPAKKQVPAEQPVKKKKTLKEKRREKKAALAGTAPADGKTAAVPAAPAAPPKPTTLIPNAQNLTPLQQKMRAKLTSARFRHINETLYTSPSASSLQLFSAQPEMYNEYHLGFRQQVTSWPENPVDTFISLLRSRSKIKFQKGYSKTLNSTAVLPLPQDRATGICTVADLGCGDAKLAATFNHGKGAREGIRVLSYDLQASTPDVTVADIANLPLEKETVDIVIFCLALMGTNFLDFIDEAHRILKDRGELWVAEIKSRFHRKIDGNSNAVGRVHDAEGGDEPEMAGGEKRGVPAAYAKFVTALAKRGFVLKGQVDDHNRMFVRMEFVKTPEEEEKKEEDEMKGRAAMGAVKRKNKWLEEELKEEEIMKPCVYKLR